MENASEVLVGVRVSRTVLERVTRCSATRVGHVYSVQHDTRHIFWQLCIVRGVFKLKQSRSKRLKYLLLVLGAAAPSGVNLSPAACALLTVFGGCCCRTGPC